MVPSVTLNQDGRYLSRLVSAQGQTSNYIKLQNARTHYLTHADSEWRLFIPSSLCFICVCVCESMLRLPRASTREFKMTLYSSFSLLLNNNHRAVVPPRTSYVLSACSRVRTHKTNKHVQLYTRWHTPTRSNPHAQILHTSHRAVGLLCNLNRSFSGEKHVLLFHFISFDCATSHPPPFLPQLYHSATCSPPQTPLLKSQATSRAPTAALSCWPCDDLSVHSVCLWTDMDMQMKGSSTFEFLRECQCNINVTKQSGL